MNYSKISLVFLAAVFILMACSREQTPDQDPVMSYYSDTVCKFTDPLKGDSPGQDQTCVNWSYRDDTLFLTHYNAGFNCCPEKILTSMHLSGDTIYLKERDSLQLCRCNCLYDIDYAIAHLAEGSYVIAFDEPFVTDPKEPLVFQIDLDEQQAGSYCQERDYYPWGVQ